MVHSPVKNRPEIPGSEITRNFHFQNFAPSVMLHRFIQWATHFHTRRGGSHSVIGMHEQFDSTEDISYDILCVNGEYFAMDVIWCLSGEEWAKCPSCFKRWCSHVMCHVIFLIPPPVSPIKNWQGGEILEPLYLGVHLSTCQLCLVLSKLLTLL